MRSRPIGTPLSESEAATVARFDAAPDADESLRVRVTEAIRRQQRSLSASDEEVADAAIAVMRGDDA